MTFREWCWREEVKRQNEGDAPQMEDLFEPPPENNGSTKKPWGPF